MGIRDGAAVLWRRLTGFWLQGCLERWMVWERSFFFINQRFRVGLTFLTVVLNPNRCKVVRHSAEENFFERGAL